jgi:ferredoxin
VDLFKKLLPSNNYDYYLCGPTAMMDSLKEGLAAWGVPKEKVHFEDFSPPREAAKLDAGSATGPPITFKKSGKTVNWNTAAKNLLEFALANEVPIDAGCWLGNCGTCQRAVVKGEFDYAGRKVDFSCEAGSCLTCCAVPKGAMEIDA